VINIKSATEIFEMAKNNKEPSDILELICYTALKNIIYMYKTRQINEKEATRLKILAFKDYSDKKDSYSRAKESYAVSIANIKRTEVLRAEFNKKPTLDKAIELIGVYSGETKHYENMRRGNI
jgi:hypothetical protein